MRIHCAAFDGYFLKIQASTLLITFCNIRFNLNSSPKSTPPFYLKHSKIEDFSVIWNVLKAVDHPETRNITNNLDNNFYSKLLMPDVSTSGGGSSALSLFVCSLSHSKQSCYHSDTITHGSM